MNAKEARAHLASQVTALALSGVNVYGYEPAAIPTGKTVSVSSFQRNATDLTLQLRIVVTNTDPATSQDTLDDLVEAVEAGLGSEYGSFEWEYGDVDELDAYMAQASVTYGRTDF